MKLSEAVEQLKDMSECIDLLAAVYKQAVVDDCITVRSKSRRRLKDLDIPSIKAFDYINSNNEYIKDIVRKKHLPRISILGRWKNHKANAK